MTTSDNITFSDCIRTKAPVIRRQYGENGLGIITWENADCYNDYMEIMPTEQIDPHVTLSKNDRLLLISDSENMQRKAAVYYFLRKNALLNMDAVSNNKPVKGSRFVTIPEVAVGTIDMRAEKEEISPITKRLSELTTAHCVYAEHFDAGNIPDDKCNSYIWKLLLSEYDCNMLIGITNAQYSSGEAAKLICEGGYVPVFLPAESDDYYEIFANRLLARQAIRQYRHNHPDCGEDDCPDAKKICDESECVNSIGIENLPAAINILKRRRGNELCEQDIAVLFDQAVAADKNLIEFLHGKLPKTYSDLKEMSGFAPVKDLARKKLALLNAKNRNPDINITGQHYLFVGNPGTGKTEGARLIHEVLSGEGFLTGNFVVATRQDIVASYTGQTAPKVAALFKKAAGGTLFVDEAGFFLQQQCGGFIHEAIKEFVRYMETNRDVTVIFALYPGEKERFLNLDAGLTSRIGQVIMFNDHDEELLCEIGESMWKKQGYELESSAFDLLKSFLRERKDRNKTTFGNGREVRRLVELSIQETEIRLMEQDDEEIPEGITTVTTEDLKKAINTVRESDDDRTGTVGFCLKSSNNKENVVPFIPVCQTV